MDTAGQIAALFQGDSSEVITVLISMLPIVELRGAIPWAMGIGNLSWQVAIPLAILGNMIPIPFILLLLGPVSKLLSRHPAFDRFFQWLFARTRKKGASIERYKAIGLIIFVGIPLPATGGWTGAAAAFVFGLRFWPAFFCIFAGVCLAAIVVTLATVGALGAIGAIF